ncbi:transmembrane channel-like protein 8 isoform X2 [Varanus komodoensis]|uniref:transmembrane channel-like protein 8 isoform X2 n=1 Tax=Varanus komodoensis TaxID=61221 RepID=UPI001CF787C5|nr:transmembrane channel-like protein 8 isoform X2 [Varanus komodoensis]
MRGTELTHSTQDLWRRTTQQDAQSVHSVSSTDLSLEGLDIQESMLRALACSMKKKRFLRQLKASTGRGVSSWVSWRQQKYKAWRELQENIWNCARIFWLWKPSLDEIGGNFGPGIQSYFTFLRFLLFINFLAVLLATGFIVLPVLIAHDASTFPKSLRAEAVCRNYNHSRSSRSAWQHFQDVFTGEGFLEHSYLFYGGYNMKWDNNSLYNVHLAYLLSILGYFLACFIWIFRQITASFVQWKMQRWDFKQNASAKIFTEWDFCIQSPEAAALKQKNIYNGLKMDLAEQNRHMQNQQRTRKQLAQLYLLRLLINGVILLLMVAAFYIIYLVTTFPQHYHQQDAASLGVLVQYLPPVAISGVNLFMPFLLHALAQLENYSPSDEVNLTIVRCVLLRLSCLGMFLFFLGHRILCWGSSSAVQCQPCGYNKLYQCWENRIGQEMYKMTIFNFLTTLASSFLISPLRRLLVRYSSSAVARWLGKEEFLVPHNVLDIVTIQTVIWTGIFFCPLLPLVGCASIFLAFYIKKYTLFRNCQPSTRLFRASRSKFLFQIMLLLGLFLACTPLSFAISRASPSHACGLFANYAVPWHAVSTAVSVLPASVQLILDYATSSVFCFSLLMLLSLILTVIIAQAQENRRVIERLKKQRELYVKEKWHLVKKLAQAFVELL